MIRTKLVLGLIVAAALSAVACSKSPEDKMMGIINELAGIIDSNKDDCGALGTKLKDFSASHKDELKTLKEEVKAKEKAMSDDDKKKYEEKMKEKMADVTAKMATFATVAMKCMADPKFQEASKSLSDVM